MTNPKGLHFAAHRGRVVASLQRLPCQKTKPKGLCCGGEVWWFGFICVFTRLYADGFERPTLRGCVFAVYCGRVKPLRTLTLPCQKANPRGLYRRDGLWWFDLSACSNGYMWMILRDHP